MANNLATSLNLLVLRSSDLDRAAMFYGLLGIEFQHERHGTGPEHLVSSLGSLVFEIYPLDSALATTAVRLGFRVPSLSSILNALHDSGCEVMGQPKKTSWGLSVVVVDPDGHRIELTQA